MYLAIDDLLDVVKEVERRAEQAGTLGLLIELHQEDAALVHDQGRLLEQLVVVDLHALRVEGLRAGIFERELAGSLLLTRPPQRLLGGASFILERLIVVLLYDSVDLLIVLLFRVGQAHQIIIIMHSFIYEFVLLMLLNVLIDS